MQFLQKPLQFVRQMAPISRLFQSARPQANCLASFGALSRHNGNNNGSSGIFSHWSCVETHVTRSVFLFRSGDMLWEGVTGAPGRIKKRARGKRRVLRRKIDLNWGRRVGENAMNYKWPGLNAPVTGNKEVLRRTVGEEDPEYAKKLVEIRNKQNKKKYSRYQPPLKRGWTGSRMGGQSLGKPQPTPGQNWEGFDSRVLEFKTVTTMTASKGRTARFSVVVMVGNGAGLAGIGKTKSKNMRNAVLSAKRKAALRLEYYELNEGRTIWHPDFVHDWSTDLYARPMYEGYGLVCHRLIKTMCQLIGIKDMYAKLEGSVSNPQIMIRAFTALLRKQENYKSIANRLDLNVVEVRSDKDNYPILLAAPDTGKTRTPQPGEMLDFQRLHLDGQVFTTKKYRPFYIDLQGPSRYRALKAKFRNHIDVGRSQKVMKFLADQGHYSKINLLPPPTTADESNK